MDTLLVARIPTRTVSSSCSVLISKRSAGLASNRRSRKMAVFSIGICGLLVCKIYESLSDRARILAQLCGPCNLRMHKSLRISKAPKRILPLQRRGLAPFKVWGAWLGSDRLMSGLARCAWRHRSIDKMFCYKCCLLKGAVVVSLSKWMDHMIVRFIECSSISHQNGC